MYMCVCVCLYIYTHTHTAPKSIFAKLLAHWEKWCVHSWGHCKVSVQCNHYKCDSFRPM